MIIKVNLTCQIIAALLATGMNLKTCFLPVASATAVDARWAWLDWTKFNSAECNASDLYSDALVALEL
eukprot:COSAG05_NODE_4110_length_1669_cov_2.664968_1_plen_68_part_00